MHDLAWPLAVVVIVLVALFGFRKSLSKVFQGIKLRKAPGGLEFDQAPQQQIEETKTDSNLAKAIVAQDQHQISDPILEPRMRAIREDWDKQSNDSTTREKLLIQTVAVWQENHENARIARHIFGSQLEILLHLNAHNNGESLANIRAFYDRAAQNFPAVYQSYPFEPYMAFLENVRLITRMDQPVTITPKAKGLLQYLVATGDTLPRPN